MTATISATTTRVPRTALAATGRCLHARTLHTSQTMQAQMTAGELAKAAAGRHAVEHELVRALNLSPSSSAATATGRVIGIGSGTTVVHLVQELVRRKLAQGNIFVPTGHQSRALCLDSGLDIIDIDQLGEKRMIDVAFDGADDVDRSLNCIKGGGACNLREKVVAQLASRFVLLADMSKKSEVLGSGTWKQGVPVEVVPLAAPLVLSALRNIPGYGSAKLRQCTGGKAGPVVTDNGNFVIDATFTQARMQDPQALWREIRPLTGVVDVGLFCDMAHAAYFGKQDGGVEVLRRETE